MKTRTTWVALLIAALAGSAGLAGEVTLKVGDKAPKLQVGKWVQGEAVKEFENDKVYVVEFWATWCGPCRVSIPHLNELHEKFKDKGLVVIGQDCWEREEDKVAPFVKEMGSKMTYRVALDRKENDDDRGRMAETWMAAAGQNGIPSAFLVNKEGLIVWIGHPMKLEAPMIEQVMAGTYDLKKAAAEAAEEQAREAKIQELAPAFSAAMSEGRGADAEKAFLEIEKLLPEAQRKMLKPTWFAIHCKKKDYTTAYKVARAASDENLSNAMLQNQIAWTILTDKDLEKRDLELAQLMAERGVKASDRKDASILDTLARALFMRDKKAEAIKVQEEAVSVATSDMKASLEETLKSYRDGKLPPAE